MRPGEAWDEHDAYNVTLRRDLRDFRAERAPGLTDEQIAESIGCRAYTVRDIERWPASQRLDLLQAYVYALGGRLGVEIAPR